MKYRNKKPSHILALMSMLLGVFIGASIVVHLLVIFQDFLLIRYPMLTDSFFEFVSGSVLLPVLGGYTLLSLIIFFLWSRTREAMLQAHQKEVDRERERVAIETLQRMTRVIAENITTHNAEILKWVDFRKQQGQQVSQRVEQSSRKIAHALEGLTEVAYVAPYTGHNPRNVEEMERLLTSRLLTEGTENHSGNINFNQSGLLFSTGKGGAAGGAP